MTDRKTNNFGLDSANFEEKIRDKFDLPKKEVGQSFFKGNKFKLILMLAQVLILVLGVYLVWENKIREKSIGEKELSEVYVSETVIEAQKNNLNDFFKTWQAAYNRQASFDEFKNLILEGKGRFENTPILEVGTETLYGDDLNYYFLFYNFQEYINQEELSGETMNKLVDVLITDSSLLQKGAELEILDLKPSYFDNPQKNWTERNGMVEYAREKLADELMERISGESIVLWFSNNEVPISVEVGKKLAKERIDWVYEKLKNGDLSFEAAGELLKNDEVIGEKIDPDYKRNIYYAFSDKTRDNPPFSIDNLNLEAWALGEGGMSTVVTGISGDEEILYVIIRINKREDGIEINAAEIEEEIIENTEKKVLYEY